MTSQSYPITPTQPLPAKPSLEQLKKQAKDLLKAVKAGDASACPVLRLHVRFADSPDEAILGADLSLQEVQHVVALQYGFKDWNALRDAVPARDSKAASEREMLTAIIAAAIAQDASDIHIEPSSERVRVRFRIDGVLHEQDPMPTELGGRVTRDAMQWAGLDLDKAMPQDGRFTTSNAGRDMRVHVSAMESLHGPVLTMRCLITGDVPRLNDVGFEPETLRVFREKLNLPRGMIIVTGPSGCGKSTTIYGALAELNTAERKIVTVEDPIEYLIDGIDQTQIRPEQGVDFSRALRSAIRQDADVIMAGEIRNADMAHVLIQSVLTGRLVLTTLHTEDAPGALIRLLDMGIPPFLVKDSVRCVLAQRLVRRVCENCKEEYTPPDNELKEAGLPAGTVLYRGKGCDKCHGHGFRGRTAIHSLLDVTDAMQDAVMTGDAIRITEAARSAGCDSLRAAAIRKAVAGITTLEEALRVT